MRVNKVLILFFLLFVVGWFTPRFLLADEFKVKVRFVPDGDTFVDIRGRVYRLKGVDAPEIAHKDRPAQFYAYRSRDFLRSLILHKQVKVVTLGEKRDRFNRILAYVYVDGLFVNEYMLKKGAVFCFPHPFQEPRFVIKFLNAQRSAIENKEGFWSYILSIPKAHDRYIGNRRTKRFHTLSCPFGRMTSRRNKIFFSSLKDAFWHGYAPCRRCTVWPIKK